MALTFIMAHDLAIIDHCTMFEDDLEAFKMQSAQIDTDARFIFSFQNTE